MIDDEKILMDEASRQSLDLLRESLSELLGPISKISDIGQEVSSLEDSIAEVSNNVSRKVDDLSEAMDMDSIRANLRLILQGQERILKMLAGITESENELKSALAQVDWDAPVEK